MRSKPIRITDQGQITIPKEMRDLILSRTVMLEVDQQNNNTIRIIPIPDVGGSLAAFGRDDINFQKEREQAWDQVTESKFNKKEK